MRVVVVRREVEVEVVARRARINVSLFGVCRNAGMDVRGHRSGLTDRLTFVFGDIIDSQTASNQPFFALLAKSIATLEGGG